MTRNLTNDPRRTIMLAMRLMLLTILLMFTLTAESTDDGAPDQVAETIEPINRPKISKPGKVEGWGEWLFPGLSTVVVPTSTGDQEITIKALATIFQSCFPGYEKPIMLYEGKLVKIICSLDPMDPMEARPPLIRNRPRSSPPGE